MTKIEISAFTLTNGVKEQVFFEAENQVLHRRKNEKRVSPLDEYHEGPGNHQWLLHPVETDRVCTTSTHPLPNSQKGEDPNSPAGKVTTSTLVTS